MKKMDFLPNLRNKYSIRRFTVGTASILIGSLLFLSHNGEAKAAENINDNTVVEASNDSSASQQALVEDNNTPQEKTAEVLQQQTNDKAQTQNEVEEVDNSAQPVKEVEQESTIQSAVEKNKETEQITEQKEDSIQPQKAENSKESVAEIADKATETTSTEAEPLKEEAKVEKTQTPVVESKETKETKEVVPEAATQTTQSSTKPIVEKTVVAPSTPALSPQQKVEKVKEDLSKDYDNAAVDEVLATIDVSDLTPEQLKSEVLRILIEQAAAEKDLLSPQATLPRGKEESTGYATRAVPSNTDTKKLASAIAAAEKLGQLNPDNPDDKLIQDKLAEAKIIQADSTATQAQVKTATTDLNTAVSEKARKETLQRLKDALEEVKKVDTSLYTPVSGEALKTSISDGELRVADPKATAAMLEKRIKAIESAKSKLILNPDKTELKKALERVKSLGELNYADNEDNGVVTARDAARTIYEYTESPQSDVDLKVSELNKAIDIKLYQDALDRLNAALKDAKTINQSEYTPATAVPFDNAIQAGDTQAVNTSASPDQLDDATKSIQETKAQLQRLADKVELNKSIQNAEALGQLDVADTEDKAVQDKLEQAKKVTDDNNASQDQVKTSTDELNSAVKQKLYQDALDELNATIQDAEKVTKDAYTPNSVTPFDAAISAGKLQAADTNATPENLNTASNAIKNAKNALVLRADKTGLNQSITTAEAIQPLQAGNALDDALKAALTKAKTVQADLNTDQPTVDAAKIDLDNAIKAKQAQTAQEAQEKQNALDELRTALTKAEGTNTDGYTTSSSNTFNTAVTNGQSILGTPGTKTTAEIKAATQALKDAQAGLVPQADKTALNTAINSAGSYNNLNPNNPVDKALQDKLAVANTVKTNGDATPEQVNAATTDLNNALAAKKAQDNQIAQDAAAKQAALNALNDALNKAKALDKSGYTPNSVTPLTEKETAAKAIADAPESKSTAEINTATQALKDAQAGLVPKADKNELQKALDAANTITGLEPTDKEDKAVQDAINTAQTVNQDDNASPQQVTEATKAINDAVSAKAHQDALDNLNKALDQAGKVDKADYTADSLKPFNKAAESGKKTAGDNTSTVEALNKAAKNVNDALAQLVPNKTKLDTAINNAKALAPLTDSNADQLLKNALNTAETVKNNPNATPAEIKTATTNLENEINNKKVADAINTLKSAVTKANGYNEAQYTPNTFGPLKTALTAGQNILDNPTTADTQATLAKANEIEQLVGALKERADKTELGKVLDKAIAYGNLNPNDAEDKALQDAVATGQRIDGDGNATTEEVADTVKAINNAINAKDYQDALDELNKVIADAKTVHKEDYKPNTVTPLEDAVKAAETTKADASKSVEELKAAAKTITDAKNALQTKANKTELDKSVTTAENTGILDENDKEDKAVKDALDKAKTVQADQNATQEAVNTAKTELDNAVNAKNVQDTKDAQTKQEALDALKAELTKVKALDKTVYTPNTVATLTEKETAGNEIAAAPSTKTTAEINTATQALKNAQTALVQKADKTELQKALDKANTLTDLSATDKEDKAVQDAVTAANTVKSDDNATVEQVTNATKAITDAVAAKKHQDALDELNKAITETNTVQKADYKPKTVTTLETAVTAGETAKNDATKTVDELKAATKAIIDAKNALEPKADKTELQKALDKAKTLGELVATDKEDREVQEAVTVGNTVNEDDNAPAELVADTTKAINKAIAEKVHQDALDALQKAIDDANTVQKENYKPNTVAPFETAVISGKTVKDDATKTVKELNAATKAITDAKNALEARADKTELDKSVETAEKLGKLDATDKEDKAVQEALDKAKTVQADHNTSQETVNTAKTELDNAVNAKKAQDTKEAVEKQNALDALKAELKKVQAINKELYTTNSVKELTNSEVSGQDVVTNATNKTTQEIETATKALKTAQANLVLKADKTELQKALNKAKTLGDLVATDKEDKAVQDAVAAGKSVNENNNATTEQVSNATKAINNAITAKEHQDALDELNKAIKEANAVTKDNYKPNTVKSLEEAVKAGETTREDTSKSVTELKAAAKTITEAQNKLEVKADKATLNKVVKTTEALELNPSDKEDKADRKSVV